MNNLTMYEVCLECKNFFCTPDDIYSGTYTIENGQITNTGFLSENQWFRIKGSTFNDGVYEYKAASLSQLTPETFKGVIWAMSPPQAFIAMCNDIDAWIAKYSGVDSVAMSPYQSESFAGYSYSKGGGNSGGDGYSGTSWQGVFDNRLRKWRRLNTV